MIALTYELHLDTFTMEKDRQLTVAAAHLREVADYLETLPAEALDKLPMGAVHGAPFTFTEFTAPEILGPHVEAGWKCIISVNEKE